MSEYQKMDHLLIIGIISYFTLYCKYGNNSSNDGALKEERA